MLALLSPSKTLDFDDDLKGPAPTSPALFSQTKQLVPILQKMSEKQIQKLMSISRKLGKLNFERFKNFKSVSKPKGARQALLAFRGDVYRGFELEEYKKTDFERAQKNIRILSGLYGILKPLDAIQPYRLEMGTALKTERGKNLYDFWGDRITNQLQKDIDSTKSQYVINLASQEYSKSVAFQRLSVPVINIEFKEKKDGKLRTIALFAKQARGEMANFIVRNKVKTPEDLKNFKLNGYRFNKSGSDEACLLFTR